MSAVRRESKEILQYLRSFLKWVLIAVLTGTVGGLVGSLLTFNTEGLDFVMTAMFVAIFMTQWEKEEKHYTALIGLGSAALCLVLFGPDRFMIPTMLCILALLTLLRKPIEKAGGFAV